MTSRELDQFYTSPIVARECFNTLKKIIDIEQVFLIEPSAGMGSFSDLLPTNSIALDLEPKKENIKKLNFFDLDITKVDTSERPIVTIGNPPFGKNSSLALKFFNKSSEYSKYIAMILPKTFKKDSIINKLNADFHLIKEVILGKDSFLFNGLPYNVPCVFQIWEKRSNKRNFTKQKRISKYFEFTTKEFAEFAIRRVGGLAGKVFKDFDEYKASSHYYIKSTDLESDKLLSVLNNVYDKLNEKAKNTAGNPSLSKHELITIFEKEL